MEVQVGSRCAKLYDPFQPFRMQFSEFHSWVQFRRWDNLLSFLKLSKLWENVECTDIAIPYQLADSSTVDKIRESTCRGSGKNWNIFIAIYEIIQFEIDIRGKI